MVKMSYCFTGHRTLPIDEVDSISTVLESTSRGLILDGISEFYAGGTIGFDAMSAKTVLKLKHEFSEIKSTLFLPCRSQTRYWKKDDIVGYEQIRKEADEVQYSSVEYTKSCMFKRNRSLVDNSDICVCYMEKDSSGTAYTVRYVKAKGLKIINLAKR